MNLQKIKGKDGFLRDKHSQGIINTDKQAYEAYIARRNSQCEKDKKIKKLEEEIEQLREMVEKMINSGALNH